MPTDAVPDGSPPSGPDPAPERTPTRPGVVIGLLVASAFVMILNETIMSLAIPHLISDLRISATTAQWLTSGFLLTLGVVIPTTGFLLERLTVREAYLTSMGFFCTGTLVCAISPGFGVLMTGRIIQACGTAVMIPLLMTTVMKLVPAERRGTTMGTITIVIAVAPALGPTIAGAILNALSWRWMFLAVLPLALAALALGYAHVTLAGATRRVPLDLLSVVLSAVGFSGLVYGFSSLGESVRGGGGAAASWAALGIGVAGLAVFVARQLRLQREERALLDLRPFTHRSFVVAIVLASLVFMSLLGVGSVLLPLYLQAVRGASALAAGLVVLPGGLALGLLGRPVGRLHDRFGARRLMIPGALAMAVALASFTLLGPSTPLLVVVAVYVVLMSGLGFVMTPMMTASLGSLPDALYSHGSAILTTLQQVAGAAGTAAFVTLTALASDDPAGTPDAAGLHGAFVAGAVIGVLAVVVALVFRDETPTGGGPAGDDAVAADEPAAVSGPTR